VRPVAVVAVAAVVIVDVTLVPREDVRESDGAPVIPAKLDGLDAEEDPEEDPEAEAEEEPDKRQCEDEGPRSNDDDNTKEADKEADEEAPSPSILPRFCCSRISSHLSIRSKYTGLSDAKNSIGVYPCRK